MRLASKPGGRFDYVVGIMHDLTRESFLDLFGAPGAEHYAMRTFDPIFGAGFGARAAPGDIFWTSTLDVKGEEEALFGEGSFRFNDEWKLTLGGRLFDTKVDGATSASGLLEFLLTNPMCEFQFHESREGVRFHTKASITWNPTGNIMAYAWLRRVFDSAAPISTHRILGPISPVLCAGQLVELRNWHAYRLARSDP